MKPVYILLVERKQKDGNRNLLYDDLIITGDYMKFVSQASLIYEFIEGKIIKTRFGDETHSKIDKLLGENEKTITNYLVKYRGEYLDEMIGELNAEDS